MTNALTPPGAAGSGLDIRDGGGFLYVGGEILVHVADVGLLGTRLQSLDAVSPQDEPAIAGKVVRYRLPADAEVLDVVGQLRRKIGKRKPRVAPNHVLLGPNWIDGAPAYHGGEGGTPSSAPELPAAGASAADPVLVAVIDTGVASSALQLPLLAGRFHPSVRDIDPVYVPGQSEAIDFMGGHGTMVAGVLARNAPQARLLSIKVLDSTTGAASETAVVAGMQRAVAAGATVLNLSLGGYVQGDEPPLLLDEFLRNLPSGISVVAAAGNSGIGLPYYPACHERVVGVAALNSVDTSCPGADFTNFGSWVDASAPGVWVHGTYVSGTWAHQNQPSRRLHGYATWSGTSFATPMVAAAIADGVRGDGSGLGRTAREVETALLADLPHDPKYGAKLLPLLVETYQLS